MEPFPGILKRAKTGYHQFVLNREQKRWLRESFPVTENGLVAKAMSISIPTLKRFVHELKLQKSPEGLAAIKKRQWEYHRILNNNERRRLMSGCKQEKCGNIRIRAYTKKQMHCRNRAVDRHGYIVFNGMGMSDHDPDRFKIFYDEETQRSARFESTCRRYGLTIEKMRE